MSGSGAPLHAGALPLLLPVGELLLLVGDGMESRQFPLLPFYIPRLASFSPSFLLLFSSPDSFPIPRFFFFLAHLHSSFSFFLSSLSFITMAASALLRSRVKRPSYLSKLAKPEDLVPLFPNGSYIGWSGFTGVGYPKYVIMILHPSKRDETG